MTLEQLLTVEAIVNEGSFKAAADYLHKSQPSISMAIKKLEEEFGINLFSRDEYRPSLTSDGKIFFEKCKILLKEMRDLESLANQIGKGIETEIRVSIDAVSPVSLVLDFLNRFFIQHPRTKLNLKFEVLSGTIERLVDGEVDLAITPKPEFNNAYEMKLMTVTKMIPVIDSNLIKDVKKVDDAFLKNHTQIILADSARRLTRVNSGLLMGAKNLTVNDMGFKKALIKQGMGWGGLPYDLIEEEIKSKKLTALETESIKEKKIEIYMVRDTLRPMGPVLKELWESVK